LLDNTRFGRAAFRQPLGHAVIDRPEFRDIPILRTLQDQAYAQLGSSGGGNHFVEFGTVEIQDVPDEYRLAPGTYLPILSHSGPRSLGATIAGHYTKLALLGLFR